MSYQGMSREEMRREFARLSRESQKQLDNGDSWAAREANRQAQAELKTAWLYAGFANAV